MTISPGGTVDQKTLRQKKFAEQVLLAQQQSFKRSRQLGLPGGTAGAASPGQLMQWSDSSIMNGWATETTTTDVNTGDLNVQTERKPGCSDFDRNITFYRGTKLVTVYEGEELKESLDELRIEVAKWLYN